jgi:glycosyltransferase involved in cell wall biosynthesis
MTTFKISIIIPAFNEEGNIRIIVDKLVKILNNYHDYEIIFINDGSVDNTLSVLKELNHANNKIRYISFSRNFGHQLALKAGIDHATGDCAISMDADLQHPVELIPSMIEKWQEGFEIVYTIRADDPRTSFFKRLTSDLFYKLMNSISDIKIVQGTADFRLLDRDVIDVLKNMQEHSLFIRGIIPWMGFSQYGMQYVPNERFWGKSKYSVKKMIRFAFNGITSFSTKPLHLATLMGLFISLLSFVYGFVAIMGKIFNDKAVSGWTSVIVSVLFIGGIQLVMLGIIGEYLGKLFIESKRRPNYIIREKSNN